MWSQILIIGCTPFHPVSIIEGYYALIKVLVHLSCVRSIVVQYVNETTLRWSRNRFVRLRTDEGRSEWKVERERVRRGEEEHANVRESISPMGCSSRTHATSTRRPPALSAQRRHNWMCTVCNHVRYRTCSLLLVVLQVSRLNGGTYS